jgi:hypothetical protein
MLRQPVIDSRFPAAEMRRTVEVGRSAGAVTFTSWGWTAKPAFSPQEYGIAGTAFEA